MNISHSEGSSATPSIKGLRLFGGAGGWIVTPIAVPLPAAADSFHPFVLPRIPQSLLDWLTIGAARAWGRHQRCIATLLLIDCRTGRWTIRLPWQRCGTHAACWNSRRDGIPGLSPNHRVSGTFQVLDVASGEDPLMLLPSADGVHLILHAGTFWRIGSFYVCAAGKAQLVRAEHVIVNDYQSACDTAMPRLRLA